MTTITITAAEASPIRLPMRSRGTAPATRDFGMGARKPGLSMREAATQLGVSTSAIRRLVRQLPSAVRGGRVVDLDAVRNVSGVGA